MQHPSVLVLNLRGNGELVIFLGKTISILLYDHSYANSPHYRRRNCQTFNHGQLLNEKPTPIPQGGLYVVTPEWGIGSD